MTDALGFPRPLPRRLQPVVRALEWAGSSAWFLAALVAWLSLPPVDLHPTAGLDGSWGAGLALAHLHNLHFGNDIVFTYGPLGFLAYPGLFTPTVAVEALAYFAAVQFVFCFTLLWFARRILPALAAAALVFVVARTLFLPPTTMYLPVVAFIWSAEVLRGPARPRLTRAFAVVGGVSAAIELLVAFYIGVFFLACVGGTCAVARPDRRRNLGFFGLSFVVTLVILWFATGQSVGSFLPYLGRSLSLTSGYSDAMGIDEPTRRWEYVAALATVAALLAAAFASTRRLRPLPRLEVLAVTALFVWVVFKLGFVRHDGHSMAFFSAMAAAPFAFALTVADRWRVILGSGIAVVAFFGASRTSLDLLNPVKPARAAVREAHFVLGRGCWGRIANDRLQLRTQYGLDSHALDLVRGKTVHIWPYDATLAWAYPEIKWRPLPVFQTYVAYTGKLDDVDASFLKSDRAPERILRNLPVTIDGRFPAYEAPSTTLAMLCRYVELYSTPMWQVLRRVPNRCGKPRLASTVHTVAYAPVQVPRPGAEEAIVARIHGLGPTPWERVEATAFKLGHRTILINQNPFRLIPDTADHSLIMNVPASADYSGTYALSPGASQLAVIRGALGAPSKARVEYDFYRIPIRGLGVAR